MEMQFCLECKGTGSEICCSGGNVFYMDCKKCNDEQKRHIVAQEEEFQWAFGIALSHSCLSGLRRDCLLENKDLLISRLIETLHGRKFEETEKKVDRTNPHKRTFKMHLQKKVSLVKTENILKSDPADLIKRVYAKRYDLQ